MTVLEWAQSVKPSLIELQEAYGIPALWAAAQMCHESANDGGASLSDLALQAHNYAGLKWAEWERSYGCEPITFGTWEVLDGSRVDLADAFCCCTSWESWLQVYAAVLTSDWYSPALRFAADPFLYGLHVWQAGWATDPAYLIGVGGWMAQLLETYADTLRQAAPAAVAAAAQRESIPVLDAQGTRICDGWIEGGQAVAPIRSVVEGLGLTISWDDSARTCTVR